MIFEAHRGVSTEFPENTLPAFEAAFAQGYTYVELDPAFTSDGHCVVFHDHTVNRTCRAAGGTALEKEIRLCDLSYEQTQKLDAGIAKAYKFRGTKIPLLSEVLTWAKQTGVTVKIDNRVQAFSAAQAASLFDTVACSGASVAFTGSDRTYLARVLERFPDAELHYDGAVNKTVLKELYALVGNNPLTVWLPVKSSETSRVTLPTADEALCKTVKQYAKLGLWILSAGEQLEQAEAFQADIIETAGQIKPCGCGLRLFDCHTHTHFSHDSKCDPHDSLEKARSCGLAGLAFTDHCDNEFCETEDVKTPIFRSADCAHMLSAGTDVEVLAGVEIGEGLWHLQNADELIAARDFDLVLGSVHAVRYKDKTMPYSGIDFSLFSPTEIAEFLSVYFADMLEMIQKTDFDVLSHLTCPLRYICGKYGFSVDLAAHTAVIDIILSEIIRRGIALEVNTSCLGSGYDALMPNADILKRYRQLGGYLITVGSDAHRSERVAHGFEKTREILRELGFRNIFHYRKRIPIPQSILS